MAVHVLNGDALAEKFPFDENRIICRECFIDGPITNKNFGAFWRDRSEYLTGNANDLEYHEKVVKEFARLKEADSDEINLWFEHDLFCQTNLWFTLYFLSQSNVTASAYVVMPLPEKDENWSGFGKHDAADLIKCFDNRVKLNAADWQLAVALWMAYQDDSVEAMNSLSKTKSQTFPKLNAVCAAHNARRGSSMLQGRPYHKLKSLIDSGLTDFQIIFNEFRKTEGIYGFGDSQVKKMLSKILS